MNHIISEDKKFNSIEELRIFHEHRLIEAFCRIAPKQEVDLNRVKKYIFDLEKRYDQAKAVAKVVCETVGEDKKNRIRFQCALTDSRINYKKTPLEDFTFKKYK